MWSIHGYCEFCKESIYADDEYVCVNRGLYHVECAEALEALITEVATNHQEPK